MCAVEAAASGRAPENALGARAKFDSGPMANAAGEPAGAPLPRLSRATSIKLHIALAGMRGSCAAQAKPASKLAEPANRLAEPKWPKSVKPCF